MKYNCLRIRFSGLLSVVNSSVVRDAKDSSDRAVMTFVQLRYLIVGIFHGE